MDGTLYVGVDGGGTHCRARIRDASLRLIGEGQGGPANARLGAATAMGSVVQAAKAAAAAGGIAEAALGRASVFMGLAGAIDEGRKKLLLAEPNPFSQVQMDTDAYIAWAGAHGGRDGGIVILGTGSAGLAVVKGRRFNVGGWGNVLSDDGSGNDIGEQAVRRALWALDGMAEMTPLASAILDRFDRDQNKMVTWGDQARPTDFAQFAPLVLDHAAKGDALGKAVMQHAAAGAARIAQRLLDVGAPSLALLGGLAAPMTPWLPPAIQAHLVQPEADALEGAILLARQSTVREGARA
jgi:glucosamine kinase